jgi:uncharacterized protein YyaL (SSP411 family)
MLHEIRTMGSMGRYYSSFLNIYLAKRYLGGRSKRVHDLAVHLDAAIRWICRAQDAGGDGGVARSYSIVYNPYFGRKGWIPSYPETTGYIIPTLFDYARMTRRQDLVDRAVRMADWECDVQMESGAVQGGTIDQKQTPAIFNTGQVIFGWLRAWRETGNRRYLRCAARAGRYLVENQSRDGAWRRNLSKFASSRMFFYIYNTRTAWALLLLSGAARNMRFRDAAIRNIEFSLLHQRENGWFESNCLRDPAQPLLHTIAYAIRGVLESGVLLNEQRYIAAARKAADALLDRQRQDGSLAGCFNERWEPTVSWSCLTGNAQIAGIWGRLFQLTGTERYKEGLIRANTYLRSVQLLETDNPDLYGGISGSEPLHAPYGRFEVLNWAVKFFADSLMMERSIHGDGDAVQA